MRLPVPPCVSAGASAFLAPLEPFPGFFTPPPTAFTASFTDPFPPLSFRFPSAPAPLPPASSDPLGSSRLA